MLDYPILPLDGCLIVPLTQPNVELSYTVIASRETS
jgi:hypothetical protein